MLNLFPIQFLALFAYFFLRISVGVIFLYFGFTHYSNRTRLKKTLSVPGIGHSKTLAMTFVFLELLLGALFVVGLFTQAAALTTMMLSLTVILFHKKAHIPNIESRTFYALLFFAALSLFITGAGVFAFDLPI